jgi:hypothetical protein
MFTLLPTIPQRQCPYFSHSYSTFIYTELQLRLFPQESEVADEISHGP